jgi:phage gpG-like protein
MMAAVNINFNASVYLSKLHDIINRSEHLQPALEEAGQYMVRSTVNRIKGKKSDRHSPSGEPWAPLSQVTIDWKGHDQMLFQSGEMADSVKVESVTNDRFVVVADSPHAGYMQRGVRFTRGKITGARVPPRPFMGFSEANIKRITKILLNHIAGQIQAGDE